MRQNLSALLAAAVLSAMSLLLNSGCAVPDKPQSAGSYIDDKQITARIKAALYSDPTVKGTQIDVNTLNGEVQLSGFVGTPNERHRAEEIANSFPGVRKVNNNLLLPTGR